jgi:sirohydrochlorin ferrochelatase
MERRAGPEYAFNEPLLEQALEQAPYNRGPVIIALQFLAPGRHAGAGGDIATICAQAEASQSELRTQMTATIGAHPLLIEVLAERYHAARDSLRAGSPGQG